LRGKLAGSLVDELVQSAIELCGSPVIAQRVTVGDRDGLRQLADRLRDRQAAAVVVLGAVFNDKPALLATVSPELISRGLKAGDIIREIAPHVDGRGGGRPDLAEAGGKNSAGLDAALSAVPGLVERVLST
jgi:alanyl-tRNA synthetase